MLAKAQSAEAEIKDISNRNKINMLWKKYQKYILYKLINSSFKFVINNRICIL